MDVFVLPDGEWFVYGAKVSLWTGVLVGTIIGGLATFRLKYQAERVWYLRGILFVLSLLAAGILSLEYSAVHGARHVERYLTVVMVETGIEWGVLWARCLGLGSGICAGILFWVPILTLTGRPEWVRDDILWHCFLVFCLCLAGVSWGLNSLNKS